MEQEEGRTNLQVICDNKKKLTEVWLSNTDQANPDTNEKIEKAKEECRKKGHFLVVFRSGRQDVTENTKSLFQKNAVLA